MLFCAFFFPVLRQYWTVRPQQVLKIISLFNIIHFSIGLHSSTVQTAPLQSTTTIMISELLWTEFVSLNTKVTSTYFTHLCQNAGIQSKTRIIIRKDNKIEIYRSTAAKYLHIINSHLWWNAIFPPVCDSSLWYIRQQRTESSLTQHAEKLLWRVIVALIRRLSGHGGVVGRPALAEC